MFCILKGIEMDPHKALQWLYSFDTYASKYGLERIIYLVDRLKNPQQDFRIIHVTGTNGKGSVCKCIGSMLQQAGYRVGVYLSPHLQQFSERITMNNVEIPDQDIALLVEQIKPVVDEMIQKSESPTFFEIVTAMAFLYFRNEKADYAVVEVGLGGRLDATNIVQPVVSVITNVSLEHTEILGDSIRAIATEKAGIIKQNTSIVTAAKHTARDVIESVATEQNAPLTIVDNSQWKRIRYTPGGQEFLIHGRFKDYPVKTSMLGEFQGENIALAVATVERLQMLGLYISDSNIIEGISNAANSGRMEIVAQEPMILVDGAHNPGGVEMLRKTLTTDFHYDKLLCIVGILKDKDYPKMLSTLAPLADIIICTQSTNPRACNPVVLQKTVLELGFHKQVFIEMTIPAAIDQARSLAKSRDLICITGSLYTVGEAKTYLSTRSHAEITDVPSEHNEQVPA